ncbi:MAG: FAD-dependent oxidoreductase [bacterium]|nr:FAD-dependent oxidoreductase [bacterium]
MIRIQQVKVPLSHDKATIENKIRKLLHLSAEVTIRYTIVKRSIDARKKPDIFYVYTVDVTVDGEARLVKRLKQPAIQLYREEKYQFVCDGTQRMTDRPVIIGAGPAGLFCCYELAKAGFAPILLERGKCVEERTKDVTAFWDNGTLNTKSNVQFGEGGAGTFSDGKLNTGVKDPCGRNRHALELFHEFGAAEEILYDQKPHIGTDVLVTVIRNMRNEIIRLGGTIRFESQVTDVVIENGSLKSLLINDTETIDTPIAVFAIGHSARDTFQTLADNKLMMEAKSFAVGFRVEHPQQMINESQYGADANLSLLPVAPYKVTANFENHRGVYSFCMCPGGFVVNASSEEKRLAINGMSYQKRDSSNANSAIIVSVTPEDYPGEGPLAGIDFQRQLEEKAFHLAGGNIPQQLFGDFCERKLTTAYGDFESCHKGEVAFADLNELMTPEMNRCFVDGMNQFAKRIHGFNRYDAILSGMESRTSSPVRICRNEQYESNIRGIYPCGEGAGYAGGITSAAIDGMKVAEAIAHRFCPIG